MHNLPPVGGFTPDDTSALHPSWCYRHDDDMEMHRSLTTVIRDRDDIRVDGYLVDYGSRPMISLEITTDPPASLVEFSVAEATRLYACVAELVALTRA